MKIYYIYKRNGQQVLSWRYANNTGPAGNTFVPMSCIKKLKLDYEWRGWIPLSDLTSEPKSFHVLH